MLLAAVVCVLGLGTTMVVSAHREYKYNLYPVEAERNILVKQNSIMKMKAKNLDEAYEEIELGIKSLKLGHIPIEMTFKQGIIDGENAIIEFDYKGVSVYLREEKYTENNEVMQLKASDRKEQSEEVVYNKWLKKDMIIEQNSLKSGLIEFSTFIDGDGFYYSLSGKMDEDEFTQLVQGLYY